MTQQVIDVVFQKLGNILKKSSFRWMGDKVIKHRADWLLMKTMKKAVWVGKCHNVSAIQTQVFLLLSFDVFN